MRPTATLTLTRVACVAGTVALSLCAVVGPAAAHGGDTAGGVPGWVALLGGVLGLWIVIGGGVVVADRLLRGVLGTR